MLKKLVTQPFPMSNLKSTIIVSKRQIEKIILFYERENDIIEISCAALTGRHIYLQLCILSEANKTPHYSNPVLLIPLSVEKPSRFA